MNIEYLKKATHTAQTSQQDLQADVQKMLAELESGGEDTVRRYSEKFDQWITQEAMQMCSVETCPRYPAVGASHTS